MLTIFIKIDRKRRSRAETNLKKKSIKNNLVENTPYRVSFVKPHADRLLADTSTKLNLKIEPLVFKNIFTALYIGI